MPITQKRLFVSGSPSPQQLTASSAVYYTVPQGVTTIVKQIILTNVTASARTVTVRLKPQGVTEAATHDILSAVTLAANETLAFNCSLVMNNNGSTASASNSDQITALCSAISSVNITINGVEES
jgi:hypothetical protein